MTKEMEGGNAAHVANLAAPATYRCRNAGSELDCRAVVELPLQFPATKFSWGHDRRIGRAAVLGITEASPTQAGYMSCAVARTRCIGTTSVKCSDVRAGTVRRGGDKCKFSRPRCSCGGTASQRPAQRRIGSLLRMCRKWEEAVPCH